MYSIYGHGRMIADRVRMNAYAHALRQAVTRDSIVLDLGTGTGTFALLACQFGARKVYAIEPNDVIQVAREIAAAGGYAGRIEFIQNLSTKVALPEQADVMISDLRGVLPLFQHHIPSLVDARERLLKTGGILIPQQDTIWAAVVEAQDLYSRFVGPWDETSYGFDMSAARQKVVNTFCKGRVNSEQLLVEPKCWSRLDYKTIESPNVSAQITWTAARAGTAHGLLVWFDAILSEGVHLSNAPGEPELIYGSAFFPLLTPVTLAIGDTVSVALQANLVAEDYVWSRTTCILEQANPQRAKASFKQSTFFGVPLSPARLQRRADTYAPLLNEEGEIDLLILGLMDGETSLREIAHQVSAKFPTRFPNWQVALTRVSDLSEKHSQ